MSLTTVYQSFLAAPSANFLATDDASLNYITTLTTIKGVAAITKHLSQQQSLLRKKEEKVISAIEGGNAISLDVETTVEFIRGGGAYLPGIDDNFLVDHVATLPIVHVVHFDANQKIQQIRLYWDQGALLKNVDIIGARAKNWPIMDGKDQARLIASSAAAAAKVSGGTARKEGDVVITSRPISPRKSVSGDPRSDPSLPSGQEAPHEPSQPAPRASARPPPRDYHDLFVGNDSQVSPASKAARAASPTKENRNSMAPKGGAGKNFQPSRLFDTEAEPGNGSPKKSPVKTHPTKYNHFEFADGHDEPKHQPAPKPRTKSKHDSQWEFADFVTPEKVAHKARPQDVRHFDLDGDKNNNGSPTKIKKTVQPRRDAETHFEFKEQYTPVADHQQSARPRAGTATNKGLGLYQNNLYDDTELSKSPEKKSHPLSTVTNLKERKKDFDPHFTIAESSPNLSEKNANANNRPIPETRNKVIKMMDASWKATDDNSSTDTQNKSSTTTTTAKDKENFSLGENVPIRSTGINTAGDGMGGKKGIGRSWGFGDESDGEGAGGLKAGKFQAQKKQMAPNASSLWDFNG